MNFIRWSAIVSLKDRLLGKNRRAAPRTHSRNLVKHQPRDFSSSEFISNLVDLSETGVQFSFRFKMKTGTILNMVLNLAEEGRDMPILGRVVWVRPFEGRSSGYRVGVSFLDISEEDRESLRRIVRRHKRSSSRR